MSVTVYADIRVEVQLDGYEGPWTDITNDVELDGGLSFKRGVTGNGPMDVIAGAGSLAFTLDNSERNNAGGLGAYSPNHANKLAGWGFDVPVRVSFVYGGGA